MNGFPFHALVAVLGGLALTAGYLLGLSRFAARARRELEEARRETDRAIEEAVVARAAADAKAAGDAKAIADAQAAAEARTADASAKAADASAKAADAEAKAAAATAKAAALLAPRRWPIVMHTVLLDGDSKSGKSTLAHRLAFPCTEPESLRKITATKRAYPTRMLPICFVPSSTEAGAGDVPVLHAQVLRDIAGEQPGEVVDIVNELTAERARPPDGDSQPGAVIVVLIWDMADRMGNRDRIKKDRFKLAYHNANARQLIKHFVVFFNKLDLLDVPPEQVQRLVEDERAHIDYLTDFFEKGVTRTYLHGSALRGDGVIDCQGAIYTALGLAPYFRVVDRDAKAP